MAGDYTAPYFSGTMRATTNAAANTNTTRTLISAPGVGAAIRIVGMHLASDDASIVRCLIAVGGGITITTLLSGSSGDDAVFPSPGYLLPVNASLIETDICIAFATKFFNLTVFYFIDSQN